MKYFKLLALIAFATSASASQMTIQLDPNLGNVQFHASGHPSALKITGKGKAPEGTFKGSLQGISGTATFDLTSLETGVSMRDHHMKEKYLETGTFPKSELTITQLKFPQPLQNGKAFSFDSLPFQGKLKLHGLEKPVTGTAHVESDGQTILKVVAEFALKLNDYGVAVPSFAGITVADDVQVTVESTGKISLNL